MPIENGPQDQPRFDLQDDSDFPADLTTVSEYAAVVGNRKRLTTTQRLALSGKQVWEGLEVYDLDERQSYERVNNGWQKSRRLEVLNVRGTLQPPKDAQLIERFQYFEDQRTNAAGVLRANFNTPFPNGVVGMWATSVVGVGINPVVNTGTYSVTGADWAFPGSPNTLVSFWVRAVGW